MLQTVLPRCDTAFLVTNSATPYPSIHCSDFHGDFAIWVSVTRLAKGVKIQNLIYFGCFAVVSLRGDMSQKNTNSISFLEIPQTAWQNRACNPFVCVDCRPKVS